METIISEQVKIFEDFVAYDKYLNNTDRSVNNFFISRMLGDTPRICIQNKWYDTISPSRLVRSKSNIDGKYHFIYIQINFCTNEYYIGTVNRPQWKTIKKYQGSGVKFKQAYEKQPEVFSRYYIAICQTSQEAKELEAQIVNQELLTDPNCLNSNIGGGGGNIAHDLKEKGRKTHDYMIAHPEGYKDMLKQSREIFVDGSLALANRNKAIKETMNQEKYREMTRKRITKWKEENPEEYAKSRENNRKAMQSDSSKQKRNRSLEKWRNENPAEYAKNKTKQLAAAHSKEAEEKRSKSLKAFNEAHPEIAKMRAEKAKEKLRKAVEMLDLATGAICADRR